MYRFFLLGFLTGFMISCDTPDEIPVLVVGEDFSDSNVRILVIDTFQVEMSTFRFDSLVTSGENRLLIGGYTDPFLGRIKTESYLELGDFSFDISTDAELDSVALILGYDTHYFKDTTQVVDFSVHRLLDDLRPEDESFYNISEISYSERSLARRSFIPEPFEEDSLHISLPKAFGQELFDLFQDENIQTTEDFLLKFKGLVLRSGDTNDAVVGFRSGSSTVMRFYYFIDGEFGKEEFTYDLPINPNSLDPTHFNRVIQDLSNLPLEPILLDQEVEVFPEDVDHKVFIQSGSGIITKIKFPTIKQLYNIPGEGTLLSAILQITPSAGTFSSTETLRDSLSVSVVDRNNRVYRDLLINGQFVSGALNTENSEFNEEVYEIPVAPYLLDKLEEDFEVDDALILIPTDYNTSLDKIVLDAPSAENGDTKLIVTYAIYDPQ